MIAPAIFNVVKAFLGYGAQPIGRLAHFHKRHCYSGGLEKMIILTINRKILLSVAFFASITCALSLISWFIIGLYWVTWTELSQKDNFLRLSRLSKVIWGGSCRPIVSIGQTQLTRTTKSGHNARVSAHISLHTVHHAYRTQH